MPKRKKIKAPFTDDQVHNIMDYQNTGGYHPFTCDESGKDCQKKNGKGDGRLMPNKDGLFCPCGKYKQNWSYAFMAKSFSELKG